MALYWADREGFDSLRAANSDPVRDADAAAVVTKLDPTFGIGQPQS